jgi:2-polyprenyl-6-methoxyphenol hydroxylase-like FAD-dependent oxidoreductase
MQTSKESFGGKHAVVIGGSMAGLLAARVLADHFENVTLIEKDKFVDAPQSRKGVPQAQQGHALWKKGERTLNRLFPGLFDQMRAEGIHKVDMGAELDWFAASSRRGQLYDTGLSMYSMTRVFLEWQVRRRVMALPNVTVWDECEVNGFATDDDKRTVNGVWITRHILAAHKIPADLVVDATGRGTRTPRWLQGMGYPAVEESVVKVDAGYASRMYAPPPGYKSDWKMMALFPMPPHEKRLGYIFNVEGGNWLVSMVGVFGDYPPADDAGFLEFASNLPDPALYEAIINATPLSPVAIHRLPSNLWRRYERMTRFPEGLLVTGDAVCSFNPIYGQGMSVSALDADSLETLLRARARRGAKGNIKGLARAYQKAVAKNIADPWLLATSEDLRYPHPENRKSKLVSLLNWYTGRVNALANTDAYAHLKFLNVISMNKPASSLIEPRLLFKVLTTRREIPALPPAEVAPPPEVPALR